MGATQPTGEPQGDSEPQNEEDPPVNEVAEDVQFQVTHRATDQHGGETRVDFQIQGSAGANEGNASNAIARAVEEYPDYDLIVIKGYDIDVTEVTEYSAAHMELWYHPDDVEKLDLENPENVPAFDECSSCFVAGAIP